MISTSGFFSSHFTTAAASADDADADAGMLFFFLFLDTALFSLSFQCLFYALHTCFLPFLLSVDVFFFLRSHLLSTFFFSSFLSKCNTM